MILSVLVPTYRRPDSLNECLKGITSQIRPADEVIVTVREGDTATIDLLRQWASHEEIKIVMVDQPGVIFAMNAGCDVAKGEIVCLTDDDAVPRADWLYRIDQAFMRNPKLGAIGGRDVLRAGGDIPTSFTTQVGKISALGRVVGNHHRGMGGVQRVEHLKGVSMSWRADAAHQPPFVDDLRGMGAQVYFELSFCFRLAREGWNIEYDPSIVVDHYVAARFDEDNRGQRNVAAQENAAFNFYVALLREHRFGWKRTAALIWANLVGTRDIPGRVRQLLAVIKNDERGKATGDAARRAWQDAVMHVRKPDEAS